MSEVEISSGIFILEDQPLRASLGGCGSATLQTAPQRLAVVSSNLSYLIRHGEKNHLASVGTTAGVRGSDVVTTSSNTINTEGPIDAVENEIFVEEQLRSCFCTKVNICFSC